MAAQIALSSNWEAGFLFIFKPRAMTNKKRFGMLTK
jgi:hypothetical protein